MDLWPSCATVHVPSRRPLQTEEPPGPLQELAQRHYDTRSSQPVTLLVKPDSTTERSRLPLFVLLVKGSISGRCVRQLTGGGERVRTTFPSTSWAGRMDKKTRAEPGSSKSEILLAETVCLQGCRHQGNDRETGSRETLHPGRIKRSCGDLSLSIRPLASRCRSEHHARS